MSRHIPYFSFYPADFMNGVRGLSAQEVGVYTMILCRIYEENGPIEANALRLSTYCWMREKTFTTVIEKLVVLGKLERVEAGLTSKLVLDWMADARRDYRRPSIPLDVQRDVHGEGCCSYCGTIDGPFEIDHIHPWSRGGSNERDNLTLACRQCNRSKKDKTVEEWLQ
ncbi:HNH endonuclease [Paracoccus sp. AS002]|uniref:HNH endonuclease n=1 Tax=Paracoccus sp. AS002 TaxID=3019545 RepID=UPI0023E88BC0|nr:HNH endonuclease [Paracoccus sp. AS002]MDF3904676.1 HNH endonuclease [Paracoccus sp. AS002]